MDAQDAHTQDGVAEGRVAIVTGGSRGLGRNMVRASPGAAHDVIFTTGATGPKPSHWWPS